MKKVIKYTLLSLLGIVFIAGIILSITGVPSSPAITTYNVPRLPLSFIKDAYDVVNDIEEQVYFKQWSALGDKMYVSKIVGLSPRIYTLNEPNQEPKLIEGVPDFGNSYKINPKPDKKELIYYKDVDGNEQYQLYKFDFETGKSSLLTNGHDKYLAVKYHPDGDKIIYLKGKKDQKGFDICMLNLEKKTPEKHILKVPAWCQLDSWSPDGKSILIRKTISKTENDPYILDIETSQLTSLKSDSTIKANYYHHEWSKDENKIYYPSTYQSEFMQLRVKYLSTGEDSILVKNLNWNIGSLEESPDGKWLMYTVFEDGLQNVHFYNILEGKSTPIKGLPMGTVLNASFNPGKNSTIGFNLLYTSQKSDIYTYDVETEELLKWTDSEKDESFPEVEIVHYPTFDVDSLTGKTREISAYYHRPPNSIKPPYPVIIEIHGGPARQASIGRSPEWEIKLKEGVAYLAPNVRGSAGYGKTFTDLDNGKLRENSVKDIGALLDWIALQPELDENRVIVQGGSYGGYMALACATHYSDRLTGAIDRVGVSNFVTFIENTKNVDWSDEFGDINDPDMRAFLENISPINHVDKIDIPLLIIQGKNDPRVPVSESQQMVEELKAAGKPVWYIEAADEGHSFTKPWNIYYSKMAELQFINSILENY